VATGKTVAKGCGISLAVLALIASSWILGGALLMLVVGALFAEFGWLAPIGLWVSTGIFTGVTILSGLFRRGKRA
jgi:hypothetical protein